MNGCAKAVRAKLMLSMVEPKINSLSRFGFSFERGGATLKTDADVDQWIANISARLKEQIKQGPVIV